MTFFFFFLMIRRPPRSTLFPYTRSSDLMLQATDNLPLNIGFTGKGNTSMPEGLLDQIRSEEHTSELQSPDHLVCRLLLEKKKHQPTIVEIRCRSLRSDAEI